ncbi:hypothetical protein [Candidatus Thioglobus sp.]|jgi:hypothetical protein|uniref:hypothetical protein n=1 Tax=Candidatus Thioglobus sp. TaxID=2026721 RepID=UPI0017675496|nr:hypothetical protein [Candidatus Thioglobus sp.]
MKKIVRLLALAFVVIGISACGKMGELESVKNDQVTLSPAPIDEQTVQVAAAPEFDVMPHSSK